MKTTNLKRIGAEIDTVVRLRSATELEVVEHLISWIDYEYHGVRELPLVPDQTAEGGD